MQTIVPRYRPTKEQMMSYLLKHAPDTKKAGDFKSAMNMRVFCPELDAEQSEVYHRRLWSSICSGKKGAGRPSEEWAWVHGTKAPYSKRCPPCLPGDGKVLKLNLDNTTSNIHVEDLNNICVGKADPGGDTIYLTRPSCPKSRRRYRICCWAQLHGCAHRRQPQRN